MGTGMTRRETLKRGAAAAACWRWCRSGRCRRWLRARRTCRSRTSRPRSTRPTHRRAAGCSTSGRSTAASRRTISSSSSSTTTARRSMRPPISLKLTGLVNKPIELSLADLQGHEVGGTRQRLRMLRQQRPRAMQGLSSNGRFTGVRLRDVLKRVGVDDAAREVVFFGTDKGSEDVVFRQQTFKVNSSSPGASRSRTR